MSQSQEVIAEVVKNNTIVFKIQPEQNIESTLQEFFINTQEESQDGSLTV